MNNYYIYEITNNLNGKTYVGQRTCHCNITEDSYMGSGTVITAAINKYGRENFSKAILEETTKDNLNNREIYWIQKRKSEGRAEYNIAGGGQGCSNPFLYKSKEELDKIKQKMSKTRTGKPSGIAGKRAKSSRKLTTKEREEMSERFTKINRAKLGKSVIIMETEQVFQSIGEAAEFFGRKDGSHLAKCCKDGKSCYGYHVCFLEDYSKENNSYLGKPRGNVIIQKKKNLSSDFKEICKLANSRYSKKIKCIETGEVFSSIKECCRKLRIKKEQLNGYLDGSRNYPIAGMTFEKIEERIPFIINLETETVFYNYEECMKFAGCSKDSIRDNLNGRTQSCKGYHFCYYNRYNKSKNKYLGLSRYAVKSIKNYIGENKKKKIKCIETGEEYDSIADCERKTGFSRTGISLVCSGKRKSIYNLHFQYV